MRPTQPSRMRRSITVLACALLAACVARAPAPPLPADTQAPAEFPFEYYRDAAARGQTVMKVNSRLSYVAVEVRRDGPLARIGHDHVVASGDVSGYVLPSAGRGDLHIPLSRLTVDEAGLRTEAGMDTEPSQEAIDGTRRNMLEKVLEADRFPFALVRIMRKEGEALSLTITLHGTTRELTVPARIESHTGKMIVSGQLTLAQTDFGIRPFSVLGGALRVQDNLAMRYRIVAENL